jgi:hypothetical protein
MTYEDYCKAKANAEFRTRQIAVCDRCYIKYSDASVKVNIFKIKPKSEVPRGIQPLACTQKDKLKLKVG